LNYTRGASILLGTGTHRQLAGAAPRRPSSRAHGYSLATVSTPGSLR